jgi:hypothetical protein
MLDGPATSVVAKRLRPGDGEEAWEDAETEAKRPKPTNEVFDRARTGAASEQSMHAIAVKKLPALFGTHEKHLRHISELLQARLAANPPLAMAYVSAIKDRNGMQNLLNGLRQLEGGARGLYKHWVGIVIPKAFAAEKRLFENYQTTPLEQLTRAVGSVMSSFNPAKAFETQLSKSGSKVASDGHSLLSVCEQLTYLVTYELKDSLFSDRLISILACLNAHGGGALAECGDAGASGSGAGPSGSGMPTAVRYNLLAAPASPPAPPAPPAASPPAASPPAASPPAASPPAVRRAAASVRHAGCGRAGLSGSVLHGDQQQPAVCTSATACKPAGGGCRAAAAGGAAAAIPGLAAAAAAARGACRGRWSWWTSRPTLFRVLWSPKAWAQPGSVQHGAGAGPPGVGPAPAVAGAREEEAAAVAGGGASCWGVREWVLGGFRCCRLRVTLLPQRQDTCVARCARLSLVGTPPSLLGAHTLLPGPARGLTDHD